MYADDTHVYIELSQSDTHKSISSLSDCPPDISLLMKSSKLKLNSDKTEFIIIGTKQQRHKPSNIFQLSYLTMMCAHLIVFAIYVLSSTVTLASTNMSPIYASNAFTTYVISAEFGVAHLYPLLRQYQII